MGLKELFGKSIYLDANIFIYALEGFDIYKNILTDLFCSVDDGNIDVITSELTLAECLVKPCRDNNTALEKLYISYIQQTELLTVLPISKACLIKSAELRAKTGLKLPDAIHVASAIQYECDVFLTNDLAIKNANILNTVLLSDVSAA